MAKFLALSFVMLVLIVVGCSSAEDLNEEVDFEPNLYFNPPIIPLRVSINEEGRPTLSFIGPRIITPIGVFGVEAGVSQKTYFEGVEKSLIVQIGDSVCAYDLHAGNFRLEFEKGAFSVKSIQSEGDYLSIHLEGPANECSLNYGNVKNSDSPETGSPVNDSSGDGYSIDEISGDDGIGESKKYDTPETCIGASPTRLKISGRAEVSHQQVKVFKEPGNLSGQTREAVLSVGRQVTIIDGPFCGELTPGQGLFWRVRTDEITLSDGQPGVIVGWVVEESGDIYFLTPRK